ncbi:hypothetical protein [Actinophytocola xanthii]|uniref:Uncharacterized protein n=1 Tax=Actinophytocola xanthii TaxID=1912961 RepID=A0A1Q8CGZ7_9PSEU|nr:hypothetical protein [Actinophytocola xanthii]OLF13613.1 hypothetical protein BU204_26605 [Actinophytocola xanthii]
MAPAGKLGCGPDTPAGAPAAARGLPTREDVGVEPSVVTQLVTAGATLGGVVLTLLANAFLERRRGRDAHRLEALRLGAEHTRWLRDERVRAYAELSLAAEEVLQSMRFELPRLLEAEDAGGRAGTEVRWGQLRTDLRKAYNRVQLLGAESAREAAVTLWRTARDNGNDFLRDIAAGADHAAALERLGEGRKQLGAASNRFLEACREDLQETVTPG